MSARSSFSPFATIRSASSANGPLQPERLYRALLQPQVYFRRRRQNDRHRLFMDRRHDRVGLGREETEEFTIALDWCALRAARPFPRRPEPGKRKQRLSRSTRNRPAFFAAIQIVLAWLPELEDERSVIDRLEDHLRKLARLG